MFLEVGSNRWTELWVLLVPQWAIAFGFILGIFPRSFSGLAFNESSKNLERQRQKAQNDIESQRRAAEENIRQKEVEASDRLRREKAQAEESLLREAERMKREADERCTTS